MTPQQLHDIWLIINVIATLEISAIAIYLWYMFRNSARKWFFWMVAAVFAAVAVDQTAQEIKNLGAAPPLDVSIAWTWLAGRVTVVTIAAIGLAYMVFGRNGKPVAPVAASVPSDTPEE